MDIEIKYQDFKEKHEPSLLGSTVRNESPSGERDNPLTDEAGPVTHVIKENPIEEDDKYDPSKLEEEGALLSGDEHDELNDLLDQEGQLKEEALQMKEKLRIHTQQLKKKGKSSARKSLAYHRRGSDTEMLPEDDNSTSTGHPTHIPKAHEGEDADSKKKIEYYRPHDTPTPNQIVEKVNDGSYVSRQREEKDIPEEGEEYEDDEEEDEEDEEEKALENEIAKKLHLSSVPEPEVPDATIENDSVYIPPAAMSEGSSSRLLQEQIRSRSRGSRSSDTSAVSERPHLASGESYHGGLSNDDFYSKGFPLDDVPRGTAPVERRPRHEPGTVKKQMHASSLNYLRSISSSRSRIDNDKVAQGYHFVEEGDLKDTGGLVNDNNLTQIADLEEAMDDVLKEVSKGTDNGRFKGVQDSITKAARDTRTNDLDAVVENGEEEEKQKDAEEEGEKDQEEVNENVTSPLNVASDIQKHDDDEEKSDDEKTESGKAEIDEPVNQSDVPQEKIVKDEEKQVEVGSEEAKAEKETADSRKEANESGKEANESGKEITEAEKEITETGKEPTKDGGEEVREAITDVTKDHGKEIANDTAEATTNESEGAALVLPEVESRSDSVDAPQKERSEQALDKSASEPVSNKDDIDSLIAAVEKERSANVQVSSKVGETKVSKAGKMTFEDEPVYLYTSLAGGMQIATRTNRLETILTANKVKFQYRDLGTDPEAKRVWRTYSEGKTLPGVVRGKNDFIGNWQDVEEANEEYAVRSLIYESY
ncbi:DEKNAAC104645 [Brettanomyces naardenensis]|uniref:DEKNAAC104645 n=1 Tax=Brettanomyces naardenensis TaxID=13370 RepID=A0A448YQZ4_BRENA|nr:DEKNAAC104645 [Brettanomyces naardenensis]